MDFSATAGKSAAHHDTHALPPKFIQKAHWGYQNMKRAELETDLSIVDFGKELTDEQKRNWKPVGTIQGEKVKEACTKYASVALGKEIWEEGVPKERVQDRTVFECVEFPGLQVIPGLLPPETQVLFTSQLMHRDLADVSHKINLQADYNIPYPPQSQPQPQSQTTPDSDSSPPKSKPTHPSFPSFFLRPRALPEHDLIPKPDAKCKPLNTEQFLYSKLRWLTLGEQYDWPTRSYAKHSTAFPSDLRALVKGLFPHIRPESGVVLVYSAKDFMPVHRDVSEQCETALASFSVGCDGIFVMAKGEDPVEDDEAEDGRGGKEWEKAREPPKTVAIRVRSGDVVHLEGEARWAWHAMARTIPGTCPEFLRDWPVGTQGVKRGSAEEKRLRVWKGWMGSKRINVSCRQVWD
ncbi:hypothetical protein GQ43DRAFT_434781 [Delitschia confertaspora ATCC 74209]|uniref:Alpha-ketoglutarate-dependent dioxygenase AlkB-like domain-containing protein n=1 Tax=Delitschia confertaspora ATCC 74209 TaxID=1513339 RepID=A0A9P4JIK5_9PLEO|nr:hypothetical protein GQ43DRAFT_434781 [Delitschia confertaspora ATCC 74209]